MMQISGKHCHVIQVNNDLNISPADDVFSLTNSINDNEEGIYSD